MREKVPPERRGGALRVHRAVEGVEREPRALRRSRAQADSPQNALELMQSGKLSALMEKLTDWFDWVVIDSPPVLPLGDTSMWMRVADGALLVARQGVTERKLLKKGLEALDPAKLLGTVLNGSTKTAHSDYYYQAAKS